MFSKLAFKNVGRSMKDYGVWFLTIAFGVCLFYVFNSLETQAVFQYLGSGPQAPTAQAIRELIGMLSVFVWVVLAFLILYASGFLIRRRKGELGTYLLLGMERGQVARLLLLETLCMGVLAVAYAMLLTRGLLRVDALFWVMIGLGSLGTLLFFRSLSGFLLRVCQSSKRLYYRNLNMFVLRQFNARINTTYRSMTVICLMLLLAIGITASSVGLNNTVEQMTAEQAPQDVELIFYPEQEGEVDLPALLAEGGFDPEAECAFSLAVPVYRTGEERAITQSMHDAIAGRWGQDAAYAFRAHHGLDVQPDDAAQGAHIDGWYFLADYAGDKYAAEARFQEALSTLNTLGVYGCTTRIGTWMEVMGTKVLVLFIGLYLGVVFLLASAAVLALQQLTQAADNAPRYQLLARLGAPERMRARSVDIQVFLSFFLPLALALVHAAVGMTAANAVIAEVGKVDAAASSAVAAVLLLVIYGGYFLATCWGSRRIVRGG